MKIAQTEARVEDIQKILEEEAKGVATPTNEAMVFFRNAGIMSDHYLGYFESKVKEYVRIRFILPETTRDYDILQNISKDLLEKYKVFYDGGVEYKELLDKRDHRN